jgi:hypothetical protein
VKSELTDQFLECFARLPDRIKSQARKSYRLWKSKPSHPSVNFKLVGKKSKTYSVRVAIGWRALGLKDGDTMVWFWIGSHAEYDEILKDV